MRLAQPLDALQAIGDDLHGAAEALEHAERDFLISAIVLDHQHPRSAEILAYLQALVALYLARCAATLAEQCAQAIQHRAAAQRFAQRLGDADARYPVRIRARPHTEAHDMPGAAGERRGQRMRGTFHQRIVDDRDVEALAACGLFERLLRLFQGPDRAELHAFAEQHVRQRAADHRVVIAQQHAHRARERQGRAYLHRILAGADERQLEMEAAARARRALDTDLAAHQPHQFAADREAEPGATVATGGGAVGLREGIEDLLLGGGIDTDPGVRDLEGQVQMDAIVLGERDADPDLAAFGELDGVAEQVEQHLAEVVHIAENAERDVLVDHVGQLELLVLGLWRDQRQHFLELVAQLEFHHFQRRLARVDLRERENVVDQGEQHVGGTACGLHVVELLVAELHVGDQVQHADHAVERGTQFVADGSREFTLGARGLQRLVARDLQRLALFDGLVARLLCDFFLLDGLVARQLRRLFLLERAVARLCDRFLAVLQHLHHGVEGLLHVDDLARAFERGAGIALAILRAAHDRRKGTDRHRETRGDRQQDHQQHRGEHHRDQQAGADDLGLHAGERLARHDQAHAADQFGLLAGGARERRVAIALARVHRCGKGPVVAAFGNQRRAPGNGECERLFGQGADGIEPGAAHAQQLDAVHVGEILEALRDFGGRAGVAVEQCQGALAGQRFDQPHALVLQAPLHRVAGLLGDHQARGDRQQQYAGRKADADELLQAHRAYEFSAF